VVTNDAQVSGSFLKRVLALEFLPQATKREKESAFTAVSGTAIGGVRWSSTEGYYYLLLPPDSTTGSLQRAAAILGTLPQVVTASLVGVRMTQPDFLTPHQGTAAGALKRSRALLIPKSTVPATPPDSQPTGLYDASNVVDDSMTTGWPVLKNVVTITFHDAATPAQRQALIDSVGGTVIGGGRTSATTGFYYVRVISIHTVVELHAVVARLAASPLVDEAAVVLALLIPAPIIPASAPDTVPTSLINSLALLTDGRGGVRACGPSVSSTSVAVIATGCDHKRVCYVVGEKRRHSSGQLHLIRASSVRSLWDFPTTSHGFVRT
jgi:hypothetical protein